MMAMEAKNAGAIAWKPAPQLVGILAVAVALLYIFFEDALRHLVGTWLSKEEYSHGILIPFIVAFFIWQKRHRLAETTFTGAWLGPVVVAIGVLLSIAGDISTLTVVIEYSFVMVLFGLALALLGAHGVKIIMAPMFMLLFMVPLPIFLLNNLSAELQLISSAIGVWFIYLFDISVALEGNVIDLGSMKLQVVEACSGLRYLFPLMVFGFITAYFFKAPLWKRATVFASSIPLTIIMNSLRIGVIGVTVEYWGASMAEGFLHDFEGWFVFMVCAFLLGAEMWLLTRMTADRRPLREVFGLEMPAATSADAVIQRRPAPKALIASVAIIGLFAVLANIIPKRDEIIPAHENFASFPLQIATWNGRGDRLEQIVIDELDVSDYLLANYRDGQTQPINLYVAYYGSQRTGESAHSPRTCLPGGGWKITSLTQQNIDNAFVNGNALSVNRALIEMGDQKQLVYYWFQQRGRVINNEYLVKWYLFWDALTRNRTDGALVRITSPVPAGEDVEQVDQRMKRFAQSVNPLLNDYIPL
jgi:exosortase D (VPLPA-CTERM-specific)